MIRVINVFHKEGSVSSIILLKIIYLGSLENLQRKKNSLIGSYAMAITILVDFRLYSEKV